MKNDGIVSRLDLVKKRVSLFNRDRPLNKFLGARHETKVLDDSCLGCRSWRVKFDAQPFQDCGSNLRNMLRGAAIDDEPIQAVGR